ncbi:trehalose 6-phosphate synthase [Sphingomonas jejuensis]|uniref:Trehalose 6-phosphate synthase n=1 Tax=Sphingomonas jejuensis TaxID=904715 RepID=A0ABX0XM10_9SPHN|nr:trehalose-6-phosphate synthase [Sphingomonas jejuensis]NJC33741.1 trehalose 6-phosphate synthase [Sphingomonas jejuensis]
MSRLIIVSNRVQPPADTAPANQGGLAVALASALREHDGIWCGWSGETTDVFTGDIRMQTAAGVTTATIDLEEQDVEEYYNGFANRTLWPLLHHRTDLAEHEREFAGGYERVNQRFADIFAPLIEGDDLVWVHDYHLFPLGRDLRQLGVRNRIGFFLHTPWPPTQLLLSLPSHRTLVESLFDYDLIGFQTEEWLNNFEHYLSTELGLEPNADGEYRLGERSFRVLACPIGIDGEEFAELSRSPAARYSRYRMKQSATGRDLIVGVDRLDYSKGLEERFLGYERFLANNPEQHSEVFLLQIAPPSRGEVESYQAIRSTLDALSGRINGNYADIDWVPIRYVNQGYPRAKLAGIYRAAKIGLVTPLRDGMNLVAKEYVAAQDPEDPGVLILSRFAGAAAQLKDAVLVNPYSSDDIADGISQALTMRRGERTARWEAMMHNVTTENVAWWLRRFTDALEKRPTTR